MSFLRSISVILLILGTLGTSPLTRAADSDGGEAGNGGDPGEIKFKMVALNIQEWLESGNADAIHLPMGLSFESYKAGMLAKLRGYQIEFTESVVKVAGTEKTCKNDFGKPDGNKILCNSSRFNSYYSNSMDDIYRIVHHEFAGLAGFEKNKGEASDYVISAQLSDYLRVELVKRLPIHGPKDGLSAWLPAVGWLREKGADQKKTGPLAFTLDTGNPISTANNLRLGGYKSTAKLFSQSVALEAEDPFYHRKIETQADGKVSILRQDRRASFEAVLERVPGRGWLPEARYRCTLLETGEEIQIERGTGAVQFPSQKSVALSAGKLVVTATDDAIFLSQYNRDPSSGMPSAPAKAVVKIMRGSLWAHIKFFKAAGFTPLSVDCEMF